MHLPPAQPGGHHRPGRCRCLWKPVSPFRISGAVEDDHELKRLATCRSLRRRVLCGGRRAVCMNTCSGGDAICICTPSARARPSSGRVVGERFRGNRTLLHRGDRDCGGRSLSDSGRQERRSTASISCSRPLPRGGEAPNVRSFRGVVASCLVSHGPQTPSVYDRSDQNFARPCVWAKPARSR